MIDCSALLRSMADSTYVSDQKSPTFDWRHMVDTSAASMTSAKGCVFVDIAAEFEKLRGRRPETVAEVVAVVDSIAPTEAANRDRDGWGRLFRLEVVERAVRLRSAGADGTFDTPDDIVME